MENILPQIADVSAHPNDSRIVRVASQHSGHTTQVLETSRSFGPAEVERFLHLLGHGEAGGITEIRILCKKPYLEIKGRREYVGKTVSGYYEPAHYAQAARDLAPFDGKASIYVTLNPVRPSLLARAANRLELAAEHTTADADILCRLWLPFDFDPVRPSGVSASEPELLAALARRDEVAADLEARGAQVLAGASGNGGHLLVRVQGLPNEGEGQATSKAAIEGVLRHYSATYSDGAVNVDTTVANAARIWKVYGTMAAKGDSLPERPHRRAHLDFPEAPPEPFDLAALPALEEAKAALLQLPSSQTREPRPGARASERYVAGAMARAVASVAETPSGQKHAALLKAAHNMGGFLHTGDITPEEIEHELLAAVNGSLSGGTLRTIRDGIKTGQAQPHTIPEPTPRSTPSRPEPQVLDGAWMAEKPEARPPRFESFSFADMARLPRPEWLVRGLLVERTASVLSADSGAFKSFFALELGLCIATGHDFHGRAVKQGPVVYVAAEGFYTLLERARGWAQVRGCELPLPENFQILRAPINVADAATVAAFAAQIEAMAPALVILDTLSQCAIGANENDNGQMADFVRGMISLGQRIGAHVQTLHHNGKATGTFRGAGAIKANVDAHISMERPENAPPGDYTVFVRCEKQRGKPFEPFTLRGTEVELPEVDEYGDPITTLVFEQCGDGVPQPAKHPNATRADKTRDALMAVFDAVEVEERGRLPHGVEGVRVGFWKEAVEKSDPPICSTPTFWRYRTRLEKDGAIRQVDTYNGSPIYQRSDSTLTTITTLIESCDSEGQDQEAGYYHNSHHPLGVRVVIVPADGGHSQSQDDTAAEVADLFGDTAPPKSKAKKSKVHGVDSEPYNGCQKKGGEL